MKRKSLSRWIVDGRSVQILGLGLLLAAGLWWVPACSAQDGAPAASPSEGGNGDEVWARVGDRTVTRQDVETTAAAQLRDLERRRFELLENTLRQLVQDRLLEVEAAQRGMSKDELVQAEVQGKLDQVPAEEVDQFYTQNQARIRQPKEQVERQIRELLAYQKLIDGLESKYKVDILLEPPRIEVAIKGHPAAGPENAPVTIVEFSDFECPFCARLVPALDEVRKNYGDKVRLVFRQFPLTRIHPHAQKAAEASLCAHDQGKFWEMHDLLFQEQKSLTTEQLKEKAVRLGLDAETFNACLDSGKYAEQVAKDLEEGTAAGVSGTPAIFVNGRFISGAVPYNHLASVIDQELARKEAKQAEKK